jgi:hypothetical protein
MAAAEVEVAHVRRAHLSADSVDRALTQAVGRAIGCAQLAGRDRFMVGPLEVEAEVPGDRDRVERWRVSFRVRRVP